jgi:hypothetical protein
MYESRPYRKLLMSRFWAGWIITSATTAEMIDMPLERFGEPFIESH